MDGLGKYVTSNISEFLFFFYFYRATAKHTHCFPTSVRLSVRLSNACIVTKGKHLAKKVQLENVAIANALQLEAARRRTVPIRFNSSPVPSLKSLSLSVAVTLNLDPVTLTFDL